MADRRAESIARGIVAGYLTDQVRGRGGIVQRGLAVVGGLALLLMVIIDGWWRWLMLPLVLIGVVGFLVVYSGRRLLMRAITRIAPPGNLEEMSAAVTTALEEADLPDGPLGIARMVWRLRRGVGPELDRLRGVLDRLTEAM